MQQEDRKELLRSICVRDGTSVHCQRVLYGCQQRSMENLADLMINALMVYLLHALHCIT